MKGRALMSNIMSDDRGRGFPKIAQDFVERAFRAHMYADAYAEACLRFRIERMWALELSGIKPTGTITVRRPTREAANG